MLRLGCGFCIVRCPGATNNSEDSHTSNNKESEEFISSDSFAHIGRADNDSNREITGMVSKGSALRMQAESPTCLTLVIFIIPKMLAAAFATPGRRVLIRVPFQAEC